ncbi:hypothetical protein [Aquabacterium sp.]|uniref:hypothetical protein n=1 Tax=Aquabacterium sp. TaxID=1872578 RepID=UPI00248916B8|nr:hypothetical protein [Aquabacterium sp.]MDI1259204.1 hypothetical protein [Aquabacterium sp.]
MERVREVKFTLLMCLGLLGIAAATSIVLYQKELASIELLNFNASIPSGATLEELLHLKQQVPFGVLLFALPILPMAALFGKRRIQCSILLSCGAVLLLAFSASPGGDIKGCEECSATLYLSLLTSAASYALLVAYFLWVQINRMSFFKRF